MAPYSMAISIIPTPIVALSIILSLGEDSYFLNKICSNKSQTYAPNTPFANNLKTLLNTLYVNTPKHQGFSSASSDSVYGLALCRGDLSSDDCEYCLHDAQCKATNHCYRRTALVWYDNCQLKYSEKNFLGKIDKENRFVKINDRNVTGSQKEKFRDASIGLLRRLSGRASAATNKYMFAGGEELFDKEKNETLYGMAQCTRDLLPETCNKCLDGAVKGLPIYNGSIYSVGARVVGASCTVRYETHAFLRNYGRLG